MTLDLNALAPYLIPLITLGIGAAIALSRDWLRVKKIFGAVRVFVDTVDDSIYDDKVTEQEFRNTFDSGKKVLDALLNK